MAIKSLVELRKLRVSLKSQVDLRVKGESLDNETIEVLIGMGTCGIAAGARDSLDKLLQIVDEKELANVKIVKVGCVGFCHMEPTIQVNIPGKEPVIYGKITEDQVEKLVDVVIINGELLEENYLIQSFGKAVI